MSAFLAGLLSEFWKPLAAGAVALLAGLGLYAKGRSDQKAKAELKDLRDANEIRRDGAAARAGANPDRMHDDGFKRD